MPHGIVSFDDEAIKGYVGKLVAKTVEETPDAPLGEEASRLVNAERYERADERQAHRSGHCSRRLVTGCVLSSLVEPLPSRICEPLPVTRRRAPDGVRHDEVSHSRHRNPSRSRHAAPPPMRAWRTRHDSPLNCTSLPWWTTLSITAAAIWSSPKTLPHMLNSRLVVNTTDWRS